MVVHQHHEARVGEHTSKALEPMLLYAGEAMRHRDRRMRPHPVGHKQPAPQHHVALGDELDVLSLRHLVGSSPCRTTFTLAVSRPSRGNLINTGARRDRLRVMRYG
jgi:hypothetical protein